MIFLVGSALLVPVKMLLKLAANSIVGAVLLMVINFIGMNIGIMIPVNVVNALVVGVLGVPGVVTLLLLCN